MYKIASESAQRRRDRFTLADVAKSGVPEALAPEERLQFLTESVKRLDAMIQEAKARSDKKAAKALGLQKAATQDLIRPITVLVKDRNRRRHAGGTTKYEWFYHAAKELLPSEKVDEIYHLARQRQLADPFLTSEHRAAILIGMAKEKQAEKHA